MDVIGYGDADVDIFLTLDRLPERDEKILAESYSLECGGMVTNTIVALSRLGRRAGFHGKIGDDLFGKMALKNFHQNQVDTTGVMIKKGGTTFFCVILLDPSREKALVSAPTDCRERYPEDVSEDIIRRANHLHTTAIFLPASVQAVQYARKHGLSVSMDMDARVADTEDFWDLLPQIDVLFVNQTGARRLSPGRDITQAAQTLIDRGGNMICITLGEAGSFIQKGQKKVRTEAFQLDVKDTTGAGDCFAAGVIQAFRSGWSLEKMGLYANAVAAISTTAIGGHTGAPTHPEVVQFLSERGIDFS
jgi:ribokinase